MAGSRPSNRAWVDQLNSRIRLEIRQWDEALQYLVDRKLILPFFTFQETVAIVKGVYALAAKTRKMVPRSKKRDIRLSSRWATGSASAKRVRFGIVATISGRMSRVFLKPAWSPARPTLGGLRLFRIWAIRNSLGFISMANRFCSKREVLLPRRHRNVPLVSR